ncbi:hypothetical protein JMJ35_001219 [Cladonia borealis]|uniref:Uncharacterized protein n=1 Tax=Cladonia borealis TaxID=184061 RepID=A0AA39R9I8_9LECA|nr:hypothetical protein JMJ35_001219 [Cladonia borealis]
MSIYLGDDTDDNSDEDLARYSVARDPDIQHLRGQINDIRQNCWPIMATVLDKIAEIKLRIKGDRLQATFVRGAGQPYRRKWQQSLCANLQAATLVTSKDGYEIDFVYLYGPDRMTPKSMLHVKL